MEINSLFVYGSLKRGYLRGNAWPHEPISIREGIISAKLFDLGPYPGILISKTSNSENRKVSENWVLGELWTVSAEHIAETLATLDDVEEFVPGSDHNQYLRKVVSVDLEDGTTVDAYTYEYADRGHIETCRRIESDRTFNGISCAAWPDRFARVPKSFQDE